MKNEMKNCKLVLGNGFDLFCGLDTRYQDFFDSQALKHNLIKKWRKEIDEGLLRLNELMNDENLFIPSFSSNDEISFWDLLFYFEPKNDKKNNWCDVEQFILDFFVNEDISKETAFDILYNWVKNTNKAIPKNYLWLKYPSIYLINSKVNTNTKIDFATELLDELNIFEKRFGEYVDGEFSNKLLNEFRIGYQTFFKQLQLNWNIVSIDTFNYTSLESVNDNFGLYDAIIHHINGDYTQPIFGIDSSNISINKPAYIFTKTYRRMTADFYEGEKNSCILEDEFDDIVIFGHSLNEQDYSYYFPLFDYINLMDISSRKGIYFYYYIYDSKKRRNIKNTNIKNLVKMLNAYEKYKTNKSEDFRLVDTLSSQGRLRFKEVKC